MTHCSQLINPHFPTVDVTDTVGFALATNGAMQHDYLAVVDAGSYQGLVPLEELEDADPQSIIGSLSTSFSKPLVRSGDHMLQALRVRAKFYVDVVPVVNEKNEWEGAVDTGRLLTALTLLTGAASTGSLLIIEMPRHEYALGLINRLVESNDAMIMHLNTVLDEHTGMLQVIIRINKEDISDIVATFQRHDYHVLYYYGEESYDNQIQNNLDHLLNYLSI